MLCVYERNKMMMMMMMAVFQVFCLFEHIFRLIWFL